jgi:hypothetical protein
MTHEIYGAEIPLDMYGPTLFNYRHIYRGFPGRNNLTAPISMQVQDLDFEFGVDFVIPPETIYPQDQEFYLLDAPRCSLLELDIEWGQVINIVDGGTAANMALTDFGLTTGNPSVDVEVIQVLDKEDLPLTALVKRMSFELDTSGSPFPVTNDKIRDLPTGETIRSLLLRQYTRSTTAGQPTAAALTYVDPVKPEVDSGISRIGVRVNEKYIKHARSWQNLREQMRDQFNLPACPIGFAMLEWVELGNVDRALFTQDFIEKRLRLDVAGSVVTQANQRTEMTLTTIRANPQLQ